MLISPKNRFSVSQIYLVHIVYSQNLLIIKLSKMQKSEKFARMEPYQDFEMGLLGFLGAK